MSFFQCHFSRRNPGSGDRRSLPLGDAKILRTLQFLGTMGHFHEISSQLWSCSFFYAMQKTWDSSEKVKNRKKILTRFYAVFRRKKVVVLDLATTLCCHFMGAAVMIEQLKQDFIKMIPICQLYPLSSAAHEKLLWRMKEGLI